VDPPRGEKAAQCSAAYRRSQRDDEGSRFCMLPSHMIPTHTTRVNNIAHVLYWRTETSSTQISRYSKPQLFDPGTASLNFSRNRRVKNMRASHLNQDDKRTCKYSPCYSLMSLSVAGRETQYCCTSTSLSYNGLMALYIDCTQAYSYSCACSRARAHVYVYDAGSPRC
jgi:hypothetical protein